MKFELKLPMLGFNNIEFMELKKIDDIFMQLNNATEDASPSFTLIDPFVLKPYEIEIPTAIEKLLDITNESNLLIYNVVVLQKPIEESAVNFMAPIIFNTDNQTMAQVILENRYAIEHGMAERISSFMKNEA